MLSIARTTTQCAGRQVARSSTTLFSVHNPLRLTKRYARLKIQTLDSPLGDHKTLISSSVALALAIPTYYVFPGLVNWILVFALPPHIAVGMKHVISDYTNLNGRLWGWIAAILVFVALFRLTYDSVGLGGLLVELFTSPK